MSWGPALGLLTRVRVHEHWALAVALDASLLQPRPRFVFSDAGALHQAESLAWSLWLGVEARL